MWSFRVRNAKGKTQVIRLDPSASIDEFITQTVAALSFRSKKNLSFRAGFPPQLVDLSAKQCVQEAFANNDTIVVDQNTNASAPPATAAVASKQSKKPAPRSQAKAKAKAPAKPKPKAVGIHTLHGKPATNKSTIKRKDCGTGFVLGDSLDQPSEQPTQASAEPATKYRRVRSIGVNSKEDVSVMLVNAVSSGGAKDRVSKFFRAATRNAVEYQYAMTLANARLQAALGRKFEISAVQTSQRATLLNDANAEIKVRFKESVRKWKEETVQLLQPMELRAILKYVLLSGGETGQEMLKPFNMAQCSTRVFWNIARLYDGDIERGLRALVPDENWAFLDIRTRKMSEKALQAKANREYEQQLKAQWKHERDQVVEEEVDTHSDTHRDRNSDQVQSTSASQNTTESEPEHLQRALQYAGSSSQAQEDEHALMRQAVARATLSRIHMMQHASAAANPPVKDSTKAETDENDGEEDDEPTISVICDACNKVRILPAAQASAADVVDDEDDATHRWTCASLSKIGREQGCNAVDDEVEQITGVAHGKCLALVGICTRKQLANAKLHELTAKCQQAIARSKLDEYLDHARGQEVDDLMREILGDQVELLSVLESEKLGTPMDLVKTPNDLILRAMQHQQQQHAQHVDENTIINWQRQAQEMIATYSWLEEWRSI